MFIQADGIDELVRALDEVGNDETIVEEAIVAYADQVVIEQKKTAETMLRGNYYRGHIKNAVIRRKPVKLGASGWSIKVDIGGSVTDDKHPHGYRLASIAYINEYGKRSQAARPFVHESCMASYTSGTRAVLGVIDKKLKQHNL